MMSRCREMSLSAAVAEIADGSKVVLGHGAVTPNCVVEELVRQCDRFEQLQIFHLIYLGEAVHLVPGMEPVSYTHLDVYKRQTLYTTTTSRLG